MDTTPGSAVEVVSVTYAEDEPVAVRYRPLVDGDGITDVLDGAEQGFMDACPVYTARREARIDREGREGWMVAEPDPDSLFGGTRREWPVLVPDSYETEEELAERLYAQTPGTGRVDWLDDLLRDDVDDFL